MSESVYVAGGEWSPEAIVRSLRALLPARHHAIPRQRFTVIDTFDARVRRSGGRLTRAQTAGASKLAWQRGSGRSELAATVTQPVSFAWDLPNGALQQSLSPVIGARRLLDQAEAEAHGSLLEILDDQHKTVARLRVESSQVRLPGARGPWQPMPTVVTLTGLRGYDDIYHRLVPVIQSRPGITPCADGWQRLALQRAGASSAHDDLSLQLNLDPAIAAESGARRIHQMLVRMLLLNEPGLRADVDTEFLHDYRVALRRTRSLLGQLREVFPSAAVDRFRAEFVWLGQITGAPRDLDVLLLALHEPGVDLAAGDRDELLEFIGQMRALERQHLLEALDSPRYQSLVTDWRAFLERPVAVSPDAHAAAAPLAGVVTRRAWKLCRRLFAAAAAITAATPAADVHVVRIVAKKLRYLIDVTPNFYEARDVATILGTLKRLQRALGDLNDAHVQEARLRQCARLSGAMGGSSSVTFAFGRLAAQAAEREHRARPDVNDRLTRFAARETREACARAFKRETTEPTP